MKITLGFKFGILVFAGGLLAVLPFWSRGQLPIEQLGKAVVSIWGVFEKEGKEQELCIATGFLFSEQGDVITNDHVLEALKGAKAIKAKLSDGSSRVAQVMARRAAGELDLAILNIGPTKLEALLLGNPQVLQEGVGIRVIGFPAAGALGCETPATTQGQLTRRRGQPPEGFALPMASGTTVKACPKEGVLEIQADPRLGGALAVPGSSGSPIINGSGQAVAVLCGGREVDTGQGFKIIAAYAIPVDLALEKFEELGPRVPPHAPEIVGKPTAAPVEVEEGKAVEVKIGFWDVNGDLEAVNFIVSSSNFPEPKEMLVPAEVAGKRSGAFSVSLTVPPGTIVQPPDVEIKVTLRDKAKLVSSPQTFQFRVIPSDEAIQEAIEEASECGEVIIPARPQPYVLIKVNSFKINKCLTLKGEGLGGTIIQGNSADPVILVRTGDPSQKITIIGLTLEGGSSGMLVRDRASVELRNMKISSNENGILIQDEAQVTIINADISSNRFAGIAARESTKTKLIGVKIEGNYLGIFAKDGASISLVQAEISGNTSNGVELEGTSQVTLGSAVFILSNKGKGLILRNSAEARLLGSHIEGNQAHGIEARGDAKISIGRDTQIKGNGVKEKGDGLLLADRVSADINAAKIIENQGWGIALWEAPCHPEAGAAKFEGPDPTGQDNEISNNGKGDVCPERLKYLIKKG